MNVQLTKKHWIKITIRQLIVPIPKTLKKSARSIVSGKLNGKWKVFAIYAISKGQNRFSMLQSSIPGISKQMLANQLREMEEDKILDRIIYPEVPPRVEYKITKYGESLTPIIRSMQAWVKKDLKKNKRVRDVLVVIDVSVFKYFN